jgi:hypothetical protein
MLLIFVDWRNAGSQPVTFDWSVKFGDILTSLTIIVSVTALLISWSKDRATNESAQANAIRSAAAQGLTKIDRWQLLHLSLYQRLQPTFVETSERLAVDSDAVSARDYLWKQINSERSRIAQTVLDEEILTSYVSLLPHFPDSRSQFISLFQHLGEIEERVSGDFLEASQKDVLSFDNTPTYTSALLGNALRTTAAQHRAMFEDATMKVIQPAKEFLLNVVARTDDELLSDNRNR